MKQVSLQLSQSVGYNSTPHCNDSSGQTFLTVIIKTLWLCLQTNLLHIGDGGHWQNLVRLSTKTIKRWWQPTVYWRGSMSRLSLRHDWLLHQPTETGQRGVVEVCLLAGQRQRKHSRSNIKNGSSNHHPHTHLVNLWAAVYVCVLEHVCVSQQACQQCFICKGWCLRLSLSLSLSLLSFFLPASLDVCFECVRERVCGRILMKSDSELWQSVKEHPAEVNKLYSSQQLQQAAVHAHTNTLISPVFSLSQNYIYIIFCEVDMPGRHSEPLRGAMFPVCHLQKETKTDVTAPFPCCFLW